MSDHSAAGSDRHPAVVAVGVLAVVGALGALVMTVAHLGYAIPLIGDVGPGRMLLPVAIGFAVGTLLYTTVAVGAFRQTAWAWPAATVVNALAFVSAVVPVRGVESLVAAAVALAALAILVSRPGRHALLNRERATSQAR